MSLLLSRKLEESVAPSLEGIAAVRLTNANRTDTPLPLPSITVTARDVGSNYTVKVGGVFARDAELRIAVRVDGAKAESAELAETLAAQVVEAIAPRAGEWVFFQPFKQPDERSFEGNTRVVTIAWNLIVLPAV